MAKGDKVITFDELKKINPEAYERCLEALIDDYNDVFVISADGTLRVYEEADEYGLLGHYPQVWKDGDWDHEEVDEEWTEDEFLTKFKEVFEKDLRDMGFIPEEKEKDDAEEV